MKHRSRDVGTHWENIAGRFLTARGLSILTQNYQCRLGEIDLIALHHNELVFVEVRYRASGGFGSAAATVGAQKQARILKAARHFLMMQPQYAELSMRLDVIAISGSQEAQPVIRWIRSAFDGA